MLGTCPVVYLFVENGFRDERFERHREVVGVGERLQEDLEGESDDRQVYHFEGLTLVPETRPERVHAHLLARAQSLANVLSFGAEDPEVIEVTRVLEDQLTDTVSTRLLSHQIVGVGSERGV